MPAVGDMAIKILIVALVTAAMLAFVILVLAKRKKK